MHSANLIFIVDELDWINPSIVIHIKKDMEGIRVYVNYHILNVACIHDLFPTSFNEKLLDQVSGKESHSFTNGFLGYHHFKFLKNYKKNKNFTTKWGSFLYNVMSFRLKNTHTIFSRIVIIAFREFLHNFLLAYFDDSTFYSLLK